MAVVRDFSPGDEVAIRSIMQAAYAADGMPGWSQAQLELELSRLPADPSGVLIAEDAGTVVGYWAERFDDLTIHPAHRRRGHGQRLAESALARVADRGGEELVLHVAPHIPAAAAFARSVGLTYRSSLWLFSLPAERAVAAPGFPADFTTRPWAFDEDAHAFAAFANAAWEGHPTPLGLTPDLARYVAGLPGFDPDGICIVTPSEAQTGVPSEARSEAQTGVPSEPVGFTKVELRTADDGEPIGWIGQIGVLPSHRGRGLGRALLHWGIGYLRAKGAGRVELAVEAQNERALSLYRRTGFEPSVEWPHWTRPAVRGA